MLLSEDQTLWLLSSGYNRVCVSLSKDTLKEALTDFMELMIEAKQITSYHVSWDEVYPSVFVEWTKAYYQEELEIVFSVHKVELDKWLSIV